MRPCEVCKEIPCICAQPYRPQPGDKVLVDAVLLIGDEYHTGITITSAIRPLHAGQEAQR